MTFKKIVFLDDIARSEFWPAKEFFYDMLRTVIKQASGIKIESSVRECLKKESQISENLSNISWTQNFENLNRDYIDIIEPFISKGILIIGYEMSPGLIKYLTNKKISWIDFRISPIRFLPDLVIAVRSSLKIINKTLISKSLSRDDVEMESAKIMASYRHNENYKNTIKNKTDKILVVGQTESDASIIYNNHYLKLNDFEKEIKSFLDGRSIGYIPHPSSNQQHILKEMSFLKTLDDDISIIKTPLYDLFCQEQNYTFVGISSGALQEAEFFGKNAITLYQPICNVLYRKDKIQTNAFWQIGFKDFVSVDFWKMVIFNSRYRKATAIENFYPNELRKLHNVWWGYSAIDLRNNNILHYSSIESENKIKQILKFCLNEPSELFCKLYNFYGGEYIWNDRVVNFDLNGKIYCNNIKEGEWYFNNTTDLSIIIIWECGYWIDKATTRDEWKKLNCINNLGHKFVVTRVLK